METARERDPRAGELDYGMSDDQAMTTSSGPSTPIHRLRFLPRLWDGVRSRVRTWAERWRAYVHVVARFWSYLKKHSVQVWLGVFCTVGVIGMQLIQPWPIKFIFDKFLKEFQTF
jgi:hypothetical protein